MTKWTATDLPDLAGRTAVVTGASGGIGLITAHELAGAGARMVLAVRDTDKGAKVARAMAGDTEVRQLDVSSLDSVRAFADAWTGDIDILINNAGIMQVPLAFTADGFESQAATNYFGPFALTNLLLPHITDRVVTVSSQLHRRGHLRTDDLNWKTRTYNATAAYCDSKLDVTLFAIELDRRLTASGSRVRSLLAHPGIAATNLTAHVGGFPGFMNRAMRFMTNDAEVGALSTLYAAVEDIPGGSYVGPSGVGGIKGYPAVRKPSRAALAPEAARALWAATAALTGSGAGTGTGTGTQRAVTN
ncbi:NAD(P)-dependent dehydrogenase (short-subunit alcohol dehydrogenase family) [Streptacidiphilus sp. BW17]|uniref:oxidoreductase n=1 Tax=Streptacidiphilus sp. BW17 TaxID=3156274 RepID=UPI0035165137